MNSQHDDNCQTEALHDRFNVAVNEKKKKILYLHVEYLLIFFTLWKGNKNYSDDDVTEY